MRAALSLITAVRSSFYSIFASHVCTLYSEYDAKHKKGQVFQNTLVPLYVLGSNDGAHQAVPTAAAHPDREHRTKAKYAVCQWTTDLVTNQPFTVLCKKFH